MGLFVLSGEEVGEETIEGCLEAAKDNIELFKDHPDYDYLLDCFAVSYLKKAAELVREKREVK
jgi:hypothetical protein